jgi:hypothetical protein
MVDYRVYFRSPLGTIIGRHEFDAADDGVAVQIAGALCEACLDVCETFELWSGVRQVSSGTRAIAVPVAERHQQVVLESEIAIRDSVFSIAQSRRLLDRIQHAGGEPGPRPISTG